MISLHYPKEKAFSCDANFIMKLKKGLIPDFEVLWFQSKILRLINQLYKKGQKIKLKVEVYIICNISINRT